MTSKIEAEKRGGAANLTKAGMGRPKGAQNKATKALKDMILAALDKAGGTSYLVKQAQDNPAAFLTLIGKVLPTTLTGDPDNPMRTIHTIELVALAGSSSTPS